METPTQGRPRRRTIRWLLVVVLAWSAVLRFWLVTVDPSPSRLWDERFTVANVTAVLERGAFEPQNYWYGSLSYLPQLAVVAAWEAGRSSLGGGLPALLTPGGRGFTPAGYIVSRAFQALYGLLSIVLVFLLGRRLFSPWVGFGGAFLLAASPRHVHASAVLKPDVLLVLLTLASFALFVEALHRLRLAPYLVSGVMLGLATATKLNGGALALPLSLGTVLRAGPPRRWLHLAAAGVASMAAYVVLNPQLVRIWEAFQKNRQWYAQHSPEGRPQALAEMAGYLFDPAFHGPVVAALALVGAGVLARRAVRAGLRSAEGAAWAAFLSFPLLYVAVYLAVTTRAKENHFLQVLPFTALLAALAVEAGWRLVAARWPAAGVRRAAVAALALGALLAAWPTAVFAYSAAVPRTEEQALRWVRSRLPEPLAARMVIYGPDLAAVPGLGRLPAGVRVPEDLASLPGPELALADAVVVRRSFLAAEGADAVLRYVAGLPPEATATFAGAAFSARGPEVVAAVRPVAPVGEPVQVPLRPLRRRAGVFRGRVPPPPAGAAWVSYSLTVPLPANGLARAALRVRGDVVPLVLADLSRGGSLALTPRLPAGRGAAEIELEIANPPPGASVSATFFAWGASRTAGEEEP